MPGEQFYIVRTVYLYCSLSREKKQYQAFFILLKQQKAGRGLPAAGFAGQSDRLFVVVDNQGEVRSLQAGAADQTAVNLGLGHQTLDVLGVHASAVLNADGFTGFAAVFVRNRLADHADRFIRLLIRGRQSGADRPYGFIAITTWETCSAVSPFSAISV